MASQRTWIRELYIRLYNSTTGEVLWFGKETDDSKKPRISVKGTKQLSALKDNFMVDIYNLTYKQIITIMTKELYGIQIYAGYRSMSLEAKKIFDGGIVNITNTKRDYKDNICHLACASKLVASGNRFRLNFTLQSGLNMYSAIQWICSKSGLSNPEISDEFKYKFFNNVKEVNSTASSFLDKLSSNSSSWLLNTDSSEGSSLNIFDISSKDRRLIEIDPAKCMIIGDAPEISSNGVVWTSLPVFNYMAGDTCILNNGYINTGVSSYNENLSTPLSLYMDTNGKYIIWSLSYSLDNYGEGNFAITITTKAKSLFSNVVGTSV